MRISSFANDPFDAAIDVVGGSQFAEILKCLRNGGRYGVAGAISGPVVELDLEGKPVAVEMMKKPVPVPTQMACPSASWLQWNPGL